MFQPTEGHAPSGHAPPQDAERLLHLYEMMLLARAVDDAEMELIHTGEAFFHVSGAGHEGAAILHYHLTDADWLHCHYRDKALLLARGVAPEMFLHSALCNASAHSAGRQMSAHMSDPARRILSIVGPVGNSALQAVGVAAQVKDDPARPIVLCGLGDGTSQQGEVLEAIAEAVRSQLPVLFWIEDNQLSISTSTSGKTFYNYLGRRPEEYYGLPLHRFDGRDPAHCDANVGQVVEGMRASRGPAIVIFEVERLANHTNADDERVYRASAEIEAARSQSDPLRILATRLHTLGYTHQQLDLIAEKVQRQIQSASETARSMPDPAPVFDAKCELPEALATASEYVGNSSEPRLTMLESIREVLRAHLAADVRVTLYGEDIEDPKGDVFGVTRGLTAAFPGRVINSALSESTIMGVSIGRALAGGRPVAFLQFADFLPLAFNQIISELGSMHWRTAGGWQCPVIVMIACGAYRPGLGPFHAQTLESIVAHVPGIDVFMPSTAGDAAGMLNAAFQSERPTLFFYPKVCLNDRDRGASNDTDRQLVVPGKARHVSRGVDLTLVSWGSTMPLCERVADILQGERLGIDLIDLRSISPWDEQAVRESAARTGRLLIVHEDNSTCGFGAEIAARVTETSSRGIACRRVARPDTYVPCNFANQLDVLPSFRSILTAAAELLDWELTWETPPVDIKDVVTVDALGSSPADQSLTIVEWLVKEGTQVRAGQPLADAEADKAVVQVSAPVAGTLDRILTQPGEVVKIGAPLALLRTEAAGSIRRRPTREAHGVPRLRQKPGRSVDVIRMPRKGPPGPRVGLSTVYTRQGSGQLTNADLTKNFPGRTEDEIIRRTGIESRDWLAPGETALTMAIEAARRSLDGEKLNLSDISAIVCSTTTPMSVTPSMACRVLHALGGDGTPHEIPAYDVNAACSGYLYALAAGYDHICAFPDARVMIVTTEAMSEVVDPQDFSTSILFGDAASATILYGPREMSRARWSLERPILSARGESGETLSVEYPGAGFVKMGGKKVFAEAVVKMSAMLERACVASALELADLRLIVPHQANGRIIEAIQQRLKLPSDRVFNNIRRHGNTSSSSIPLCLAEINGRVWPGDRIGLCAFGGGFTFGAAIVEMRSTAAGALPAGRECA